MVFGKVVCDHMKVLEWNKVSDFDLLNHFDLWKIYIPNHLGSIETEFELLRKDEQLKSESFSEEEDRIRYVLSRICVKKILSNYIKVNPSEIEFKLSHKNKPILANYPMINFNLSHSGQYIIFGLANKWSVGVDIKLITPHKELFDSINDFMSSTEVSAILNSDKALRSFYKHWTRKESLLKGIGIGLTDRLRDISCNDGLNLVPIEFSGFASYWKVWSFEIEDSYSVSIAHDSAIRVMRFYEL